MLLIKNVKVNGEITNILINGNQVSDISKNINEMMDVPCLDGKGRTILPAFVDIHTHLREPGFESKEDITTGLMAAVSGGYSAVCPMPNTNPVTDNKYIVSYIKNRAKEVGLARVFPIGAISKGLKGEELAEMASMQKAGAVAVSDDGMPVTNSNLMRKAMEYADGLGMITISHSEDKSLAEGHANEGANATRAGIEGISRVAEEAMVAREILLADSLGTAVHIAHVSTTNSVDLVRWAKAKGIKVTCETCPHYIVGTDELILDYDCNAKVNPPLREEKDRQAIIAGLIDGTIDAIATDHAPHTKSEKDREFALAPNGISGLESAFSLCYTALVESGLISLQRLSELMSKNPSDILNLPCGALEIGGLADFVIIDTEKEYEIDSSKWYSKGKNTPFNGYKVKGQVMTTIVDGNVKFNRESEERIW